MITRYFHREYTSYVAIETQIQNLPTARISLNRGFQIDLEKRAELLNFKGISIAQ